MNFLRSLKSRKGIVRIFMILVALIVLPIFVFYIWIGFVWSSAMQVSKAFSPSDLKIHELLIEPDPYYAGNFIIVGKVENLSNRYSLKQFNLSFEVHDCPTSEFTDDCERLTKCVIGVSYFLDSPYQPLGPGQMSIIRETTNEPGRYCKGSSKLGYLRFTHEINIAFSTEYGFPRNFYDWLFRE